MTVEAGSTVEFTYTDKSGETRVWKGQVRKVNEDKGYFMMKTQEAFPRTFRFENVQGEVKVLEVASAPHH